jgi:hypothetical protein
MAMARAKPVPPKPSNRPDPISSATNDTTMISSDTFHGTQKNLRDALENTRISHSLVKEMQKLSQERHNLDQLAMNLEKREAELEQREQKCKLMERQFMDGANMV